MQAADTMPELSRVFEHVRLTQGITNTETSILPASFR